MSLVPSQSDTFALEGLFKFSLSYRDAGVLTDAYRIRTEISAEFPKAPPRFWELDCRIPRKPEYHVNPDDSFCLGSTLRLKKILHDNGNFRDFVRVCLDPYLYAVTYKLRHGGSFIIGELDHGVAGELADCCNLFGLEAADSTLAALRALSQKKRISNKKPCPCGCENRLGVCRLHLVLNSFRNVVPRFEYARMFRTFENRVH